MKKIDLSKYQAIVHNGKIEESISFDVKKSIVELLFIPQLKLNGSALLQQNSLAEKIQNVKEEFIVLEEEEYSRVKKSFDLYEGFDKNAVELVRRVLNAETIDPQTLAK